MLKSIAAAANASFYETLAGLKWLVNVAVDHEGEQHRSLFVYEEALGYSLGHQLRDKDGLFVPGWPAREARLSGK